MVSSLSTFQSISSISMISKVMVDTVSIWNILAKKPVDINEVNLSTHMKKVIIMKKWPYPSGSNAIKNFTLEKIKYFFMTLNNKR